MADIAEMGIVGAEAAVDRAAALDGPLTTPGARFGVQSPMRVVAVTAGDPQSPTSIVVAHRIGGDLDQVRTLSVDGAPAGLTGVAVTLRQRPRALVTSPRSTDQMFVVSNAGLTEVISGLRVADVDERTTFLTYAGG